MRAPPAAWASKSRANLEHTYVFVETGRRIGHDSPEAKVHTNAISLDDYQHYLSLVGPIAEIVTRITFTEDPPDQTLTGQ